MLLTKNQKEQQTNCQFTINSSALEETPTKKIVGIRLIVEYENPQAYGYPEICRWAQEFKIDQMLARRK